jgi:hypothetical protein
MAETTTASPWEKPSEIQTGGSDFVVKDAVGRLLLITPKEYRDGITTRFSKPGETSDAVFADIVTIGAEQQEDGSWKPVDDVTQSSSFSDVGLFQGRLIAKTRGKIGKGMVLGRLIVAADVGKGNPPFDLDDPTPEDEDKARAYYDAKMSPKF